ncbi:MAG: hypothetical protein LBO05_06175 [Deltaproteobacteria bacterium]|jgi:hypothetical protein|nr:hypothetical protein [Deltaproteobacteria bacterium]
MSKRTVRLPDWEDVLSAAARLRQVLPEAVLVGGAASATRAGHRVSQDADHVPADLREHYLEILRKLEKQAGWKTARATRPVQIPGTFDGIETGVRQLVRAEPLETTTREFGGLTVTLPAEAEILRIKAVLILKRNAVRDYVDFAALGEHLGDGNLAGAMLNFDRLYPQESGESSLQQLLAQLSQPLPFDLRQADLKKYKHLSPRYHDWQDVRLICAGQAQVIFEKVCPPLPGPDDAPSLKPEP